VTISLRERGVRGVVLDIEGTTTPVSFVYDVLFPYAAEHLQSYVESHTGRPELAEAVRLLEHEAEGDMASGTTPPSPGVVDYARWLMKQDRKSPGLKLLQGLIWESGYADGSLHGDVYPDVPGALARWQGEGRSVAIYSSGSELAQRLLFSTTAFGDLTPLIARHFDTGVGPKRDAASYGRIAAAMALPPGQLLFVSDTIAELDAARDAGMQAILCVRDDGAPVPPDAIRSFDEFD
jgi:enolase-phosphatase E1